MKQCQTNPASQCWCRHQPSSVPPLTGSLHWDQSRTWETDSHLNPSHQHTALLQHSGPLQCVTSNLREKRLMCHTGDIQIEWFSHTARLLQYFQHFQHKKNSTSNSVFLSCCCGGSQIFAKSLYLKDVQWTWSERLTHPTSSRKHGCPSGRFKSSTALSDIWVWISIIRELWSNKTPFNTQLLAMERRS